MKLTIVIPFWKGNPAISRLIDSIGGKHKIIVVQDADGGTVEYSGDRQITVIQRERRGYFSGTCNTGMEAAGNSDVLILNQDSVLSSGWEKFVREASKENAIAGDGVFDHPAWVNGYVQGTFMYISRECINKVGRFNVMDYPLWGATCEYQLRACRAGFKALPVVDVPGYNHKRRGGYGSAIKELLRADSKNKPLYIRTPPMVSVIVPCYNYGMYLPDCLESLMSQTLQSFEVVIVNDASTDDSGEIADSFANHMAGIRVLHNARNLGTAEAVNVGIRESYGKHITFLSADDMMKPERLGVMVDALEVNPGYYVYDDMIWRSPHGDTIKEMEEYDFKRLMYKNHVHAGIMYPRKAWEDAGGYPPVMNDGREDWAFNIALGVVGWHGIRIPRPMYIYRRDGQNRSRRTTGKRYRQYFLDKIQRHFPQLYATGPDNITGNGRYFLIEYVGEDTGYCTFHGNGNRRYKFGKSSRWCTGLVHQDDVEKFLDMQTRDGRKLFRYASGGVPR